MSLSLDLGTKPDGLEIKTYGFDGMRNVVHIGSYEISIIDFLYAAHYVLTNTALEPNDPRLQFVKCVKSMEEVDKERLGSGQWLSTDVPPVIR